MAQVINKDVRGTRAILDALPLMAARRQRERQRAQEHVESLLAPHTDAELLWAVKELTGLTLSTQAVCPGHSAPAQAFCDAFFARSSMAVWKASRGLGGKTVMLALLGYMEAVLLGTEVVILGGSGQQSQRVHEAQDRFWNEPKAPRRLLKRDPTLYETEMTNGGHIIALMASTKSARGPHPTRLRLDEVDEMDLVVFEAAMGQTMQQKGVKAQTVMSSTHQYPDKTMTEILKRAKLRGWSVHEWCYRENLLDNGGWLDPEEVERKRNEVTEATFRTEYDLQEPSPEARAIDSAAIEKMFDRSLGEYTGALGDELEFAEPVRHGEYATGTDWAKSVDYTITWTLRTDQYPYETVAWKRDGRRPWPVMVKDFDDRVAKYPGSAMHDKTGLGTVVDDLLNVDADGITMVGRQRADLFSEYIKAIENGEIVAPMIDWAYGEHKYCTLKDLYGSGHPPDSIVAGALAYRAAKQGAGRIW